MGQKIINLTVSILPMNKRESKDALAVVTMVTVIFTSSLFLFNVLASTQGALLTILK